MKPMELSSIFLFVLIKNIFKQRKKKEKKIYPLNSPEIVHNYEVAIGYKWIQTKIFFF